MRRTLRLLLRRLTGTVPLLLIVAIGGFLLLEAAPGDAVDAYVGAIGGVDSARAGELRAEWGLDRGPLQRFLAYGAALVRGDLGWSTTFHRPVLDVILERLPNTLIVMGLATALAFGVGSFLGVIAGARPGSRGDRALSLASLAIYAMPGFWLGLVLIVIFAVDLRWLPTGGIETIASGKTGIDRLLDVARHLILPVASLGVVYLALYLRLMRDSMAEIWKQDFVRAARARGLPRRRLILRHVARNALLPVVTMLGLQFGSMLGGGIVVEGVFAIPGVGRLALEAVVQRDMPLLLGVMLISAAMVVAVNLVTDLAYSMLDPRVGSSESPT